MENIPTVATPLGHNLARAICFLGFTAVFLLFCGLYTQFERFSPRISPSHKAERGARSAVSVHLKSVWQIIFTQNKCLWREKCETVIFTLLEKNAPGAG
jgi:hypothetical protein